jgi:predicted dehydrogenase
MRHLEALRALPVKSIAIPKRRARLDELKAAGYCVAEDLRHATDMGAQLCVVASDTSKHAEDATAAIESGLDLLVEKPLASGSAEAQLLNRRAIENDRKLFVGCVLRFSESLNIFRARLAAVGALHSVRIECQSYLPEWRPGRSYQDSYSARAAEGGVLRDLIHEIDYAGWIFGWPSRIQARVGNLGRLAIEGEEIAELNWQTAQGCIVSLNIDYLTRTPRRSIRALGEFGSIVWDGIAGNVVVEKPGLLPEVSPSTQKREQMTADQDSAFINAGDTSDMRLATGLDGVRALAVCDAARQAALHCVEAPVNYP